ncbi:uncharacterized protein H6S33_006473 [Morchella sextelata]|uniref:uncharacterized protein n=1 Tax=Morchella sextelata TaxID=1174677 RepID=UPI001D0467C7|nr:uncharacterized protein H6S33_006473 [Morchella sextelata]KAH0604805.1 hypothetical protein H6S33_006473 [Morchella sextelata]
MAALREALEKLTSLSTPPTIDIPPSHSATYAAWSLDTSTSDFCPECRVSNPIEKYSEGDVVCGDCGLVLGDRIVDTRSEWRTFSNDDTSGVDPSRVGAGINPLLHGEQLSTTIAYTKPARTTKTTTAASGGASGRVLQRAQARTAESKADQSLLVAYERIGAFCGGMSIQNVVVETAKTLFKQIDDAKVIRGKPVDAVVAACIFLACRQCSVPRTFREVFAMTNVPKKDIGRVYKVMEKFFNKQGKGPEEAGAGDGGYKVTETTKPCELIHRYCSALKMDQRCAAVSVALAARIAELGSVAGRSPISGAAACIYMIGHLLGTSRTTKEISKVAGVGEPTIRNAYKHLYNDRAKLIDRTWLEEGKGDLERLPCA